MEPRSESWCATETIDGMPMDELYLLVEKCYGRETWSLNFNTIRDSSKLNRTVVWLTAMLGVLASKMVAVGGVEPPTPRI